MSRVGYVALTCRAISYQEHWLVPLEIHRLNLPLRAEFIADGLPPPNAVTLFESPLDVRGPQCHLRYVFILYKNMIDRAIDWLARLHHYHLSVPGCGVDRATWDVLLSEKSVVSELIPQIRNSLPLSFSDTNAFFIVPSLVPESQANGPLPLGLRSMFKIIDEPPALSFEEIALITKARRWTPSNNSLIHANQGPNSQLSPPQAAYLPHYEQGPIFYSPSTAIHARNTRVEEYSPINPYFPSHRYNTPLVPNPRDSLQHFYYYAQGKYSHNYILDDRDSSHTTAESTSNTGTSDSDDSMSDIYSHYSQTSEEIPGLSMYIDDFLDEDQSDAMNVDQSESTLEPNFVPNLAPCYNSSIHPPLIGNVTAIQDFLDAIDEGEIPSQLPSPLTPAYEIISISPAISEMESEYIDISIAHLE
jgi:hypothetical protein